MRIPSPFSLLSLPHLPTLDRRASQSRASRHQPNLRPPPSAQSPRHRGSDGESFLRIDDRVAVKCSITQHSWTSPDRRSFAGLVIGTFYDADDQPLWTKEIGFLFYDPESFEDSHTEPESEPSDEVSSVDTGASWLSGPESEDRVGGESVAGGKSCFICRLHSLYNSKVTLDCLKLSSN